jgi:DNA polymerase-3 subunit delta
LVTGGNVTSRARTPSSRSRSGGKGTLDLDGLRQAIAKGTFAPVYLIAGAETLLADEAAATLVDAAADPASRDFNVSFYSADDEAARGFLAQAASFPFMAKRRVVVVRRFEKLSFRDPRDEGAFLTYLEKPSPTTVLVLVAQKLDRRLKTSVAVERAACSVSADPLPEASLPGWVRDRLAARGVQADAAACARLVEMVGPHLLDLRNEVDKVVSRYAGAGRVAEADVVETVGQYRQEVVWAVTKTFRPDNARGFLERLNRVLDTEDQPIGVATVIAGHVRYLMKLKSLRRDGVTHPVELARRVGRPFVHSNDLDQAQAFTAKQLALWLRNLQRADVQMKRLRLPQRWTLERALVNSFQGQVLRHPERIERGAAA